MGKVNDHRNIQYMIPNATPYSFKASCISACIYIMNIMNPFGPKQNVQKFAGHIHEFISGV